MNNILEITGLVVVLIAAGLLLGLTFIRRKTPPVFREIPAYTRLKRAIGISSSGYKLKKPDGYENT